MKSHPAHRAMDLLWRALPMVVMLGLVPGARATEDFLVSKISTASVLRIDGATGAFKGTFVSSGSGGLVGPRGLTIGPDGNLYVVDSASSRVKRYSNADGSFLGNYTPADFVNPTACKFGPDGEFYVLGGGTQFQIRRYHPNGATADFVTAAVNTTSTRMSVASEFLFMPGSNDFLVMNSGSLNRASRFDFSTGAFVSFFVNSSGLTGTLKTPRGFILGPDQNYWVSSRDLNRITRFDGATGAKINDPVNGGLLNGPEGILMTSDALFVLNKTNNSMIRYPLVDAANGVLGTGTTFGDPATQQMAGPEYMTRVFINDPPVATPAARSVAFGTNVSGQLAFSDPDLAQKAQTLTATLLDTPALGTFTAINPATGAFTFQAGMTTGSEILHWQVSDGALTATATLTITVTDQIPWLQVEQPSATPVAVGGAVDFHTVVPGTGGLVKSFVLRNIGGVVLHLGTPAVSGTDAAEFALDSVGMTGTVAAGGTTGFTVRFDPATTGSREALLQIPSDAGNAAVFGIHLAGKGVTAAGGLESAAGDAGLGGGDLAAGATPFNDGVNNLLKYAFHLNLGGPDHHAMTPGGDGGLPLLTAGSDGNGKYWRLEFVRRKASGLAYAAESSSALQPGSFTPVNLGPAAITSIDDFWERVVFQKTYNPATEPRRFVRCVVTMP